MTVEIALPFQLVKDLLVYNRKRGCLIPSDALKKQMKAHGYVFEKHWDVGFREGGYRDVVFVFTNNEAAMTFTMYFQ